LSSEFAGSLELAVALVPDELLSAGKLIGRSDVTRGAVQALVVVQVPIRVITRPKFSKCTTGGTRCMDER